ncbi:hypothetical protein EMIT079MI2_190063 [Bacillus sp. IT-79MI2]
MQAYCIYKLYRGCCKTKINMQCYEPKKLAEHATKKASQINRETL